MNIYIKKMLAAVAKHYALLGKEVGFSVVDLYRIAQKGAKVALMTYSGNEGEKFSQCIVFYARKAILCEIALRKEANYTSPMLSSFDA
ncbi:hypothetical protein KKH23_04250 [Patescibacteria group bacterium]|nr:hypothetical protein [Patescibacteria group bacterium]MBU0846377.1 hypothetical protein [Patescibacteria group bacterium]